MKTFSYQGYDQTGRAYAGLVEAMDVKEAREKLAGRGILAQSVDDTGQVRRPRWRPGVPLFDVSVRSMVYRELAALLRAGVPLTHALEILIESAELGANQARLAGIRDRVREGASFADAVGAEPRVSRFEEAVLQAGERAGTLDEVLDRLAGFLEEQQKIQERIQAALLYPLVVLILAIGIAAVTLGMMIPRVGRLLGELNIPLPALTRTVLAMGRWAAPGLAVLAPALILGYFVFRWKVGQAPVIRERVDRGWFAVPGIGRAYLALVNLRFARTLSLLLNGGVSLVESIPLAGQATGSPWLARLSAEQAESVRHGASLADAVRRMPPLSGVLPGWIQAGEASGKLTVLLEHAGERFQQQWTRQITRALGLFEPALILLVGAFVLLVALAILLPILSLNQTLI